MLPVGICTSVEKSGIVHAAKADFFEENVQNFFVPLKGEDVFEPLMQQALGAPVPVLAANSFLPADLKCVGPQIDAPALLMYAENAFRRAHDVGVDTIVFGSGGSRRIPDGFTRAAALKQFVTLLKEMSGIAESLGVTIVVEPLNKAECNFINSLADGAEIVRQADHPHVALLADFYHMLRDGEDPGEIVKYGDLLRHVHLAEKETRSAPGIKGDDFRPFFKALKQAGYRGRVCIEAKWGDFSVEAPLAIAALKTQMKDAGF